MEKRWLKNYIYKLDENMETTDEDMPYYANELCNMYFLLRIEGFIKILITIGSVFGLIGILRKEMRKWNGEKQ